MPLGAELTTIWMLNCSWYLYRHLFNTYNAQYTLWWQQSTNCIHYQLLNTMKCCFTMHKLFYFLAAIIKWQCSI